MHLLNLSLAQFLAVFGAVAALAVALYLLDRSRRRQVVSSLRFWVAAAQPAHAARRRRIRQPWSLILQLAGMALLLLAIAQLQIGAPALSGRDHVLILDTSAWMGARSGGQTLMEAAQRAALQYLHALPARDRVMLVRADSLATPATAFELDRGRLDAAVQASRPGASALDLDLALSSARRILSQEGRRPGEIVFAGAGRTSGPASSAEPPSNLRVLLTPDAIENCGLLRIGMRRSAADPAVWEIGVSAHNYGASTRRVEVSLDFGPGPAAARTPVGARSLNLAPGADGEATFQYRAAEAGVIGAALTPHDAFPADDYAQIESPALALLPVTVYSADPDALRPLLSSNPRIAAAYRTPAEYRAGDAGLVVLDRFAPPVPPLADSIWIDPPALGSPIPIAGTYTAARIVRWASSEPLAAGLRTKDFRIDRASVFAPSEGDIAIGESEAGPVIVARPGAPKIAVFGFHPTLAAARYQLATPLLFANLERWVSPDLLRRWEIAAGSVGTVKLPMEDGVEPGAVKVTADDGSSLPFTLREHVLTFFAGSPGFVRVDAGDRQVAYSLTIPEIGETRWQPPAGAARGIPRFRLTAESTRDLWPVLALLGGAALLGEWLLFAGPRRRGSATPRPIRLAMKGRGREPSLPRTVGARR